MTNAKPTVAQRITLYMLGRLPADAMTGIVETAMARMEGKQRDKALYEAVRKYKGKAHIHKDPVRKTKEESNVE
jgi:hypothetical protein